MNEHTQITIISFFVGYIVSFVVVQAYTHRREIRRLFINRHYFRKAVSISNFDSDILSKFKMHIDYEIDYYSILPVVNLTIYNRKLYHFLVLTYGTAI